jgi:replicative superfamily II helicase
MASKKRSVNIRYVVASATIPNPHDIALWLKDRDYKPAIVLSFNDCDRAIPLTKHVLSAPIESRNPFTFDLALSHKLPNAIKEYSNEKPTLIVCH